LGIDPIVPLTDFAELPPARAIEVIEWTARTLVRSVVDDVAAGTPEKSEHGAGTRSASSPPITHAGRRQAK
jgi:hypothetical protein